MRAMAKVTFSLVALLALSGCASNRWNTLEVPVYGDNLKASPGYDPQTPEGRRLRIVYLDNLEFGSNPSWIQKEYLERGYVDAGSVPSQDGACVVVIRPPKGSDDAAFFYMLGHEAFHCFAGIYHDGNLRMDPYSALRVPVSAGTDPHAEVFY